MHQKLILFCNSVGLSSRRLAGQLAPGWGGMGWVGGWEWGAGAWVGERLDGLVWGWALLSRSSQAIGRSVPEQAKALALYNKIPKAVLERYPKNMVYLCEFQSLSTFHENFPIGLDMSGAPVESKPAIPVITVDSADAIAQKILLPLYSFSRQQTMVGATSPLQTPFVKAELPSIDVLYRVETELQQPAAPAASIRLATVVPADDTVSLDTARELEDVYQKIREHETKEIAAEFVQRTLL